MRNDHKFNFTHSDAKATIKSLPSTVATTGVAAATTPTPTITAAATTKPLISSTTTASFTTSTTTPSTITSSTSSLKSKTQTTSSNGGDIITIITSNNINAINETHGHNNIPIATDATTNALTRITIEHCPQALKAKTRTSSRLVRFLKSTKQRKREEKQQQQQQQQQHQQQQHHQQQHQQLNGHTSDFSNNSQTTATTITTTSTSSSTSSSSSSENSAWQYCDVSHCVSFQENIADVHHRKGRRLNGLQLPLHPLQLFGWLVLVLFGIAAYWLLIPTFPAEWQGPLYGLITGLYIVHVVSHLAALLLDPADRELRRLHRNDRIVPEFDRSKHAHVIENGRCHLCNIRTTSTRTKHCSVCNKCVGKFDHHCKWLNHCVGSRNYVAFLMCVVSAVIATLVIVAAVLAQFAFYYLQPEWLNHWRHVAAPFIGGATDNEFETIAFVLSENNSNSNTDFEASGGDETLLNNVTNVLLESSLLEDLINITLPAVTTTTTANLTGGATTTGLIDAVLNGTLNISLVTPTTISFNTTTTNSSGQTPIAIIAGIGVSDTIFLVLLGFLGLLAAITAGLLLHLCFFHIYISFLGLTTYEYIRNHRQAQETRAKQALNVSALNAQQQSSAATSGGSPASVRTSPPSKQASGCAQIYCCSSLRHPNALESAGDRRYCAAQQPPLTTHGGLHCCADYREYHQTALKTYYMCSLLEERGGKGSGIGNESSILGGSIAHISGGASLDGIGGGRGGDDIDADMGNLRTFHCCSSFAASATQRKLSTATTKATLVSDLEAALSARRSYLQYTEQCTFCTFRIRSPSLAKRSSGGGGGDSTTSSCSSATSTRSISRPHSGDLAAMNASRTASAASTKKLSGGGVGSGGGSAVGGGVGIVGSATETHPRCCMKAISKQQRWRRKWNCCSSVPDSPDVPNDIIATLAMRHHQQQQQQQQQQHYGNVKSTNATEIPVHFIRSVNDGGDGDGGCSPPPPSAMAAASLPYNPNKLPAATRGRHTRTWPVARFRHMMRMFNRYRRPRCRHHQHQHNSGGGVGQNANSANSAAVAAALMAEQVKQNQIRPLQLRQSTANGCHYDSSSPMPSSTTLTPSSERSATTPSSLGTVTNMSGCGPIETILPTSVIRDDSAITYTAGMAPLPPVTITLPPALPPPTRRKIPNPTDLEELAETLAFAAAASQSHTHNGNSAGGGSGGGGGRLPALQNVYRRQRRKHFLRTRSPTLSPIHESGLSNPTSPQPGRHHSAVSTANTNNNTSSNNNNGGAGCSPANAAAVVNNLCGSGELLRKTASNSSLSSNSSSN